MGCHLISTTVPPATIDISGVTADVTAIKAVTDNLPESGALTTIDANIDAIKLVTDALPGVPTSLVGYGATSSDVATAPGTSVNVGWLTANVYATAVVDITSSSGYLMLAFANRTATLTNSAVLTVRITIDGTAFEITDGLNTSTINFACCAVGFASASGVTFDYLRFKTSLKIEVKSSAAQASGKVNAIYMYMLD